jgi:hypothetical protein
MDSYVLLVSVLACVFGCQALFIYAIDRYDADSEL